MIRSVNSQLNDTLSKCNGYSSGASPSESSPSESSSTFRIENEFPGLHASVFPIDAAVYRGTTLVAFLEVDGDTHFTYDLRGQKQLRRIDKLKMFLYHHRFPSIQRNANSSNPRTIYKNNKKEGTPLLFM